MQAILPGGDSRLLSRAEVVEAVFRLTGVTVKANTVTKWTTVGTKGRKLRGVRLGKRCFYAESDLVAFLAYQQDGAEATTDAAKVIGALLGRQYAGGEVSR